LCFNAGTDGSFQVPGFTFDVNVFDVEPRCVSEFDDYVIDGALAAVDPCNPSSNGFVCNPLTQEVISATPAMSVFLQSCPELICEEFICLAPDPSDPFGSIVVSECGCASIFPGSYSNTAGERIAFNRRQVQSNVSLVVTEP
jgi:hypothetical protein